MQCSDWKDRLKRFPNCKTAEGLSRQHRYINGLRFMVPTT